MPTSNLPISKVVNITVANPPVGLAPYQINNLLYVTKEAPVNGGLGAYTIYLDPTEVAADWGINSETYQAANNVFAQKPGILSPGGVFIVAAMQGGDTLSTIYNAIIAQVYFGGMCFGGYQPGGAEMTAAAAIFQAANQLLFLSSNDSTLLNAGQAFNQIQAAKQTAARCLIYTVDVVSARLYAAAYASLGMSTDFTGSDTTQTLALKDLSNVLPDPGITPTLAATCETVGVDYYTTIGGIPKLFSTGGNTYFDQVFGVLWLAGALQVAYFNSLATTNTKVPQTETGMALLRNALIAVLEQGVTNGFIAPGQWNSTSLFGDPDTLRASVLKLGYYVYSGPINKQSQATRQQRIAPLIQIAVKLAGAIQSGNVLVTINP